MSKIPFDIKESRKRDILAEKDFLAKAQAKTPEAFADILDELTVEKIVEKEVDITSYEDEIKALTDALADCKAKGEDLCIEIEELKSQLEDLSLENNSLKVQIGTFTEENAKLNKSLENKQQQVEKAKSELKKIKEVVKQLTNTE